MTALSHPDTLHRCTARRSSSFSVARGDRATVKFEPCPVHSATGETCLCRFRMSPGHESQKEGNVLFNDALNTFYLRLYGKGPLR